MAVDKFWKAQVRTYTYALSRLVLLGIVSLNSPSLTYYVLYILYCTTLSAARLFDYYYYYHVPQRSGVHMQAAIP